jgi:hypothetical protein
MNKRFITCGLVALGLGCDAVQRAQDQGTPPVQSQRVSWVSARVDVLEGGTPSVSVLAFQATTTGVLPGEVPQLVDPLVMAAPRDGRCELREVAAAARVLHGRGGTVELEALTDVSVTLDQAVVLRPAARVYPHFAAAVGGVVSEAGPLGVAAPPTQITLTMAQASARPVTLPRVPRLLDGNGNPIGGAAALDLTRDLPLALSEPGAVLEIRPLGSSTVIVCPAGLGGHVVVPHAMLETLVYSSGRVPVSFEAVLRDSHELPVSPGSDPVHFLVELRSSVVAR